MTVPYCDNGPLLYRPLWWHEKGLQQTASGYGVKLTTPYKTMWNGKLRRVYCVCSSNAASYYVVSKGQQFFLRNEERASYED